MKTRILLLPVLLSLASVAFAQSAPQTGEASPAAGKAAPDKASAYYHYSLGHMYEELATMYGRSEFANKAIAEYRLALDNDPSSEYLNSALAEVYAKTGRIKDAVLEAEQILKRDPDNVDAHKLLGRIYLRTLGDLQSGTQSSEILKRAIEQYQAIVRLQPESVEDHLLLGRLYRLSNEIPKAENEFKIAIKLQPYSEDANTTLAYLYNEQGDPARALQILSAVRDTDRTGRLYAALGYTYEQQKDYKNAVEAYRKAVDLDRDNLDSMRGLAQNLLNNGQRQEALTLYKSIIEADPQDPQTHMRMAEIYRRSGNFDQALESLKKAQNYVQDSLEVSYNMAIVHQAKGRFDEATQILQDLVKKSEKPNGNYSAGERNNRSVFLERLGNIYRDSGNYPQALDTFRKMLELGDDNMARGYQEIIDTYRDAKQWPEATAAANEATAKLPEDRSLKLSLALQMADTGQPEEGLRLAKSQLRNSPDDREVYLSLANMTSRLRRYKESEEYISKAAELSKPEEKDYVHFLWGSILERQKKYDAAEEMFKRVLTSDQFQAGAMNYLGYMLADRGVRLEEALGYLKKAVSLDPQNGAYLDSLGWAYFKHGQYDLAEDSLRRASERSGSDPTIQDHLAELYAKTGRLKLAAAHWERAIEEWNKNVPAEVDSNDLARVSKKLETAKVKLARQQASKAEATKP